MIFLSIKNKLINRKWQTGSSAGFSLVEILLAIGIFAAVISAIILLLIDSNRANLNTKEREFATIYAEEGIEAVRNIRDADWSNLVDTTGSGLAVISDQWEFSGASDTDASGNFTRVVEVSTIDANTKEVKVTVTWDQSPQPQGEVVLNSYLTYWQQTITPPAQPGGMLVYADTAGPNGADTIRYKLLDSDGNWGSEETVPEIGVPDDRPARIVELYNSNTRDEKILLTKHVANGGGDDQYLYAQVWDGSSWGDLQLLTSWAGDQRGEVRDIAGDYLNNGDFLLAYDDNSNTVKYRTWNGTAWSGQSDGPDVGGNPDWITLLTQPGTNNAMLVVKDDDRDTNTAFYNGTTWSAATEHATDGPDVTIDSSTFSWSQNTSSTGVLVYSDSANNRNPIIKKYTGSWSGAVNNINIGGRVRSQKVIDNPGANTFLNCTKDNGRDINCLQSSFTPLWITLTNGEIADSTDGGDQRSFDLGYEQQSANLAVSVYSQGGNNTERRVPKYRVFNSSTNSFGTQSSLGDLGGVLETVQVIPDPDSDDLMVLMGDTTQDVWSIVWDGTNDSFYSSGGRAQTEHGTNGTDDIDFWYDFAWDGYDTSGGGGGGSGETTVTINSSNDTYVDGSAATKNRNYGASPNLYANTLSNPLLRFDTSTIPAGSTITNAKLSLYATPITTDSIVSAHAILSGDAGWQEGSSDGGNAGAGEPSWTYLDRGNKIPWAGLEGLELAGTDYNSVAEDTQAGPFTVDNRYEWTISNALVQGWVNNSSNNYGLILISDAAFLSAFGTKESANTNAYPQLIVTYTMP